jgi:pimeloyl-ACP methyl ester carboxylesterase
MSGAPTLLDPMVVAVAEEQVAALRARLAQTRWPDEVTDSGWDYGTNLAYMRDLIEYWQAEYDWRARERAINDFAHFRARIDGFGVHFIHERGRGPNPLPLVLTHGWPSSFLEMVKVIPLLADPAAHGGDEADAFDVIVPSLPGYGFSDRPQAGGMNTARTAQLWLTLMTDVLGHRRFGAHGGDIGAGVTTRLARLGPERLAGIHLTAITDPTLGPDSPPLNAAERQYLDRLALWEEAEGAYSELQRTKPQTLAYGLTDSPAGLAAWIVEKFRSWSDCGGDVESRFSRDELLTNISLYWFTGTINSSMRMYCEGRRDPAALQPGERINVPTGVSLFPNEYVRESHPPREWGERTYDIRHWARHDRGGHFPALEEPELLADEIRGFFRPLREERP